MKIALLGSSGMLGQDLIHTVPGNVELKIFPRSVDLADAKRLEDALSETELDVVVNAAAFNQVDGAESNQDLAFAVNATGPQALARYCAKQGIVFVHFSTDYVFPDAKDHPFTEKDEPNPPSLYGRSKWEGEKGAAACEKHYILRTSALYGFGRDNHALRIIESLEHKKPMTIAEDLFCSPTYTRDLARWTYVLLEKNPPFGIYHLCHKGHVSRYAIAQRIAAELGEVPPYPFRPVKLADLKLPAPRATRPLLSTEKWETLVSPLPSWTEGVDRFLADGEFIG